MSDRAPHSSEVPLDDRLVDLVLQRATCGLSSDEGIELAALLLGADRGAVAELEAAVDALRLGLDVAEPDGADEDLPASVRDRIVQNAALASVGRDRDSLVMDGDASGVAVARWRRLATFGWLAAAAAIVVAAMLWITGQSRFNTAGQLAAIEAAPDRVQWAFKSQVPELAAASGDVVWSDQLQKGFIRLRGVPANAATEKQFQLWIVDPKRDQHPVDAGVFNVVAQAGSQASGSGTDEVVVPFSPALRVANPAAFAITAEKSGGVVVSAGPLLLVASPPVAP
ncbi:MAG: anti-sigma factor [Phycisphaerae bacterium]|nr:anti-sigma factor [Phycisphaerae bacterium]